MEEVLPYQIWLALPQDTRDKLSTIFGIPKTGSVNVETRATPDGQGYGSVVTRDGYTPDDLRALTIEKMQNILKTDETDFFAMFETVVDNINPILEGTYELTEENTVEHKRAEKREKAAKKRAK